MKKVTRKQRLDLIETLLMESGAGEDVLLDGILGRKRSKIEKVQAEMLSMIYTIVHPAGDCKNPHATWDQENFGKNK